MNYDAHIKYLQNNKSRSLCYIDALDKYRDSNASTHRDQFNLWHTLLHAEYCIDFLRSSIYTISCKLGMKSCSYAYYLSIYWLL